MNIRVHTEARNIIVNVLFKCKVGHKMYQPQATFLDEKTAESE